MFDPRIYRAAFLPAVIAFVALMFSLERVPAPLQPPVSTPTFDGEEAARDARAIVRLAPEREPGSTGDRAVADLVRERFSAIAGGETSVQDFDSSFRGEDVTLRNVVLTLPGDSDRSLLIVAQRDWIGGPGASSSAASTATLLALAEDLGESRRARTIVLASTDAGSDGALGASELAEALPNAGGIEAALVISQPGLPDPEPPFVIATATGPESPSAQLYETARSIASNQFGERNPPPGPLTGLARLALPAGLGEQAALRRAGIEALAISASGERPEVAPRDGEEAISAETLAAAGSTVLTLILTLDDADSPPVEGPGTYVRVGDNLLPGWTLAVLAIALLAPGLLAAGDTWMREHRVDWRTRRTLVWALERALPPLAALLLAYLLGFLGLVPDPRFPYDPDRFPAGAGAVAALIALAAAFALAALLIRPMRTPLDAEAHTLAAAGGIVTGGSVLGLWLINPYLALLLVPAAHVWLLPARALGPPRAIVIALVAVLSLLPVLAAWILLGAELELGAATPWHALLMIESGQIGFLTGLLGCGVIGGLIACVAAAAARVTTPATGPGSVRGAGGHAGPGALGATPSALPRR